LRPAGRRAKKFSLPPGTFLSRARFAKPTSSRAQKRRGPQARIAPQIETIRVLRAEAEEPSEAKENGKMAKESEPQKETVERVMHEFKHGELRSGTSGQKVKSRRQAVAIALSEAGASNQLSPKENQEHLRRAKAKERRGDTARDEAEGKRS
jgi:hypothetical protein